MGKVLIFILSIFIALPSFAEKRSYGSKSTGYGYTNPRTTKVSGSVNRRTGTYTAPHTRTAPNHTQRDNYSTKGNTNPWTGKKGSKYADK